MTKKLVTQAVVPTNATKGSVCRIDVKAVTFADLWDAYVAGSPIATKGRARFRRDTATNALSE